MSPLLLLLLLLLLQLLSKIVQPEEVRSCTSTPPKKRRSRQNVATGGVLAPRMRHVFSIRQPDQTRSRFKLVRACLSIPSNACLALLIICLLLAEVVNGNVLAATNYCCFTIPVLRRSVRAAVLAARAHVTDEASSHVTSPAAPPAAPPAVSLGWSCTVIMVAVKVSSVQRPCGVFGVKSSADVGNILLHRRR